MPIDLLQFVAGIEAADHLVYQDTDGRTVIVDEYEVNDDESVCTLFSGNGKWVACRFLAAAPIELSEDECHCTSNDGTNTKVTFLFTLHNAAKVMAE
jgi:hypothetical protein